MATLKLDQADLDSECWEKVSIYLQSALAETREANDNVLTEQETAVNRGKIAHCKDMLRVGKVSTPKILPASV